MANGYKFVPKLEVFHHILYIQPVKWKFPPSGRLKLNIEGSSNDLHRTVGIVRNRNAEMVMAFANQSSFTLKIWQNPK